MSDVPSNLIPTRVTQLPIAPVADPNSLMMIVYQGNNYQIRVGDLLAVAGVPVTRQVIAGTGMSGGGQLSSNVTLSIAPGGVGTTQLADAGVTPGVYGTSTTIPVFTVDAKGRVVAASSVPVTVSGYVPVTREVIAGPGLTGGGPLNSNVTLTANLSSSVPQPGFQAGVVGISTAMARDDHQHPAIDLADDDQVDGLLGLDNGGTARSLVANEGAIIWSGADGLYVGPAGVAGQVLLSGGIGQYTWSDQDQLDVGQADNINGGAANRIAYQTSTNVTGFISAPTTADTFLRWDGSQLVWDALPGGGTVTSVGLALPAEFTISGSPVTSSGTLTGAWADQAANKVLAGPTTGADDTPAFRALTNDDLPLSGVTADTYGSATAIPVITVDDKGLITAVSTAAIVGGLEYKGSWNASTNTPTLASGVGTNGNYYVVSVAGTTNLDGVTDWQIGDWAIFNGAAWQKIDQTDLVASVNGQVGVVVLTASDVGAQPADAQLTDIAGLTPADGAFIVGNGTNFITESGSTARTSLGAAASGANSDITSMSGLTGAVSSPTSIQMGNGDAVVLAAGKLWYTPTTGAWNLGMGGGNITQQVGEELYRYGKASSAINDSPLQIVYKTGVVGSSGKITFAPTVAGITDPDLILGVATEPIALNGFGRITTFGEVRGITTDGAAYGETWANGDDIWYNPVTGNPTKVKPSAPNIKLMIGTVLNAGSGGSGSFVVKLGSSSTLGGTDSNVQFSTVSTGDVIVYDSTAQYWKNVAQSTLSVGSASTATSAATATTASNLAGGGAGYVAYNSAAGATTFLPLGTANYVLTAGATAPQYVAQSTLSVGSASTATTATNVTGGAAGSLVYQTGAATTSTLALGTRGKVLRAGATAPEWANIDGGTF